MTEWRSSGAVHACAHIVPSTLHGTRMVHTPSQPCACFWQSIELAAIPTLFRWAIAQAMERFSIDSCVCGYHVYNDIWEASVSEELPCQREDRHAANPYDMLLGLRMPSAGRQ